MRVVLIRYCALLDCESFIYVDLILFVCYSCAAPTFSFKWNKEDPDFDLRSLPHTDRKAEGEKLPGRVHRLPL